MMPTHLYNKYLAYINKGPAKRIINNQRVPENWMVKINIYRGGGSAQLREGIH